MKGNSELVQSEDCWSTRMGGFIHQQRVIFRGLDLHRDLGDKSWMEVYLLGITGREFSTDEIRILNAIWVYTSYPDPRIWNNRIAALAGTVRSTATLGVAAATAASEAEIFGGQPLLKGIRFLFEARNAMDSGTSLESYIRTALARHRKIPGYGRPNASMDERIQPMLDFLKSIHYPQKQYLNLAFEVERILLDGRWRFRMNYAALVAALCADMGLSAREAYLCVIPVFTAGFIPCYLDALDQREGCLFPLRCSRIDYQGPAPRNWD